MCFKNGKLKLAITSETITFDPIKILTYSTPQNDHHNLGFMKDKNTYGEKMARKGHSKVIKKFSFISNRTLPTQF